MFCCWEFAHSTQGHGQEAELQQIGTVCLFNKVLVPLPSTPQAFYARLVRSPCSCDTESTGNTTEPIMYWCHVEPKWQAEEYV